jgi:thiol-disulfide isomerase/thioredoxin
LRIAPDWNLETAQADTVRFSERAQDQISLLFFWATWCPYCKALMPHLQSIRLEYGDKVEVLAINIMDDGDPVAFLNSAGYDFVLLLDGDEVADAYGVRGTPGVFVVDGNRRVHFDLSRLPPLNPPSDMEQSSHPQRAAYLAPYWAAEIRKSIDAIVSSD